MSRTYRRLDAESLDDTRRTLEHYEWCREVWPESRRYNRSNEAIDALAHSDNHESFHQRPPNKVWRRISHKGRRAMEREQISRVMKDPDHDFHIDLKNQAHRLDLWDWY